MTLLFITIIVLIVLLGLKYYNSRHSVVPPIKKIEMPTVTPSEIIPIMTEGIVIGPGIYGDLEKKLCLNVIAIENGVVIFKYILPNNGDEIKTIPIPIFLKTFHRFDGKCCFNNDNYDKDCPLQ